MPHALRPIEPADLPAVHALHRAIETADGIPVATPLGEFEDWLDDPDVSLAADTRVAESDGRLVAWGLVWHPASEEREHRAFLLGGVSAAHRGQGIGRTLLAWQLERAVVALRQAKPDLPRHARTWSYDFQQSAQRLHARFGFVPVRWGEELLLDLRAPEPPVETPAGIRIVPWEASYSEAARLAQNDAFLDHWGTPPMTEATWEHALTMHGNRLDLSFLALEGDRVVGVCRNSHHPGDEAVTGRRDGWIGRVSVVRSHRGRGIGSALLAASHDAFRAAGFTHAMLGVDRDNPTGAYTLYQRLGYRTMTRTVLRQIEV